jgi:hypothetical protein
MSTPTTYTVPQSKVWLSPDGKDSFWFYAGDVIPMALAIRMGMPGAGYADGPYFSAQEQQAILDLAGSAVPAQLLTHFIRDYDNRTAAPGTETTLSIFDMTIYGALIRVEEPGKRISRLGVRVTTAVAGATVRLGIYGIYQGSGSGRGGFGTLLHDAATVSVATTGFKSISTVTSPELEPGLYWLVVQPSAGHNPTIAGFQSTGGQLGTSTSNGAVNSGMSYNVVTAGQPFAASLDGGSPDTVAPLIYFRLQDV